MSNSWQPHGLQHTRLLCLPLSPGVFSNSCPLSQWSYLSISPSAAPSSFCLTIFSNIRVFSNELALCIRWPKDWSFSFSISPSSEYSGLLSFRIECLILQSKDSQEPSPTPQFKSINSSALSFLNGPTLTSVHDYWKNHSFG